jgi:hypothetical protein
MNTGRSDRVARMGCANAVTPRNRINKANTKKVYGHRSAKRTTPCQAPLLELPCSISQLIGGRGAVQQRQTDGAAARDTGALAG